MNKVILMGRLVKNPEVRQDASGAISMARYTLAVDRMRFNDFEMKVNSGHYFPTYDYRQRAIEHYFATL